jgi:hypothetical protein
MEMDNPSSSSLAPSNVAAVHISVDDAKMLEEDLRKLRQFYEVKEQETLALGRLLKLKILALEFQTNPVDRVIEIFEKIRLGGVGQEQEEVLNDESSTVEKDKEGGERRWTLGNIFTTDEIQEMVDQFEKLSSPSDKQRYFDEQIAVAQEDVDKYGTLVMKCEAMREFGQKACGLAGTHD